MFLYHRDLKKQHYDLNDIEVGGCKSQAGWGSPNKYTAGTIQPMLNVSLLLQSRKSSTIVLKIAKVKPCGPSIGRGLGWPHNTVLSLISVAEHPAVRITVIWTPRSVWEGGAGGNAR